MAFVVPSRRSSRYVQMFVILSINLADRPSWLCSIVFFLVPTASSVSWTTTPLPSASLASSFRALRLAWWRTNKGKVDVNGLFEQLLAVAAFYGSFCFGHGRKFDQSVSLDGANISCLSFPFTLFCLSTYLDIPGPAIQIDMHILNLPILAKHVLQVILASFLVHVCDNNDPALDTAYRHGVLRGLGVAASPVLGRLFG